MLSCFLLLWCLYVYGIGAYYNENKLSPAAQRDIFDKLDFYNEYDDIDDSLDYDEDSNDEERYYSDMIPDKKESYMQRLQQSQNKLLRSKYNNALQGQENALDSDYDDMESKFTAQYDELDSDPTPSEPTTTTVHESKPEQNELDPCSKGLERIDVAPKNKFKRAKPTFFNRESLSNSVNKGQNALNNLWQMEVFSVQTLDTIADCLVQTKQTEMMRSIVAKEEQLSLSVPMTEDDIFDREELLHELEQGKKDIHKFDIYSLGLRAFDGSVYSKTVIQRALNNAGYDLLDLNIKGFENEKEKRMSYCDNGHPFEPMELYHEIVDRNGKKFVSYKSGYDWLSEILKSGHFLGFLQNAKGNHWTAIRPIGGNKRFNWYFFKGFNSKPKKISATTVLKFLIDIYKNEGYSGIVVEGY